MRSPAHFTEAQWNTVCNSGPCAGSPGPWILSLSYRSTVSPDGWYIAFEDENTHSGGWSNDGDYNDDVFFFTGLSSRRGHAPSRPTGRAGSGGRPI